MHIASHCGNVHAIGGGDISQWYSNHTICHPGHGTSFDSFVWFVVFSRYDVMCLNFYTVTVKIPLRDCGESPFPILCFYLAPQLLGCLFCVCYAFVTCFYQMYVYRCFSAGFVLLLSVLEMEECPACEWPWPSVVPAQGTKTNLRGCSHASGHWIQKHQCVNECPTLPPRSALLHAEARESQALLLILFVRGGWRARSCVACALANYEKTETDAGEI